MKLHESLAVHGSVSGQLTKTSTELVNTFTSKHHLFTGSISRFEPLAEGSKEITEAEKPVQSNVPHELNWVATFFENLIDVGHQINVANTKAQAVITIDGKPVSDPLPATTLLEMEKTLASLKTVLSAAPTLDPAKGFMPDSAQTGVFKSREVLKKRTAKEKVPIVLYEATDKHPAQVQLIDKDVLSGTIREIEFSGMITPATKADVLARCEDMMRAVKQARSRANDQAVETTKIAKRILSHILEPIQLALVK